MGAVSGLVLAALFGDCRPWALPLLAASALACRWSWGVAICALLLGLCYGSWRVELALAVHRCAVPEPVQVQLTGRVEQVSYASATVSRFTFRVDDTGETVRCVLSDKRLRVNWYGSPDLQAGQRWNLRMNLKPPHGLHNPGGFDYEAWLFSKRLTALGSVVQGWQLQASEHPAPVSSGMEGLRRAIAEELLRYPAAPLLRALVLGDRIALRREDWRVFAQTGTTHLFVVSGLHVSLLSVLGLIAGSGVAKSWSALRLRGDAQWLALGCALSLAGVYVVISGSGLPAVRAWSMAALAGLVLARGRAGHSGLWLLFVLLALLLLDPLLALQPGTWMSFGAVCALLLYWRYRYGHRGWFSLLLQTQLLLGAAMAPLVVAFGHPVPWIGPLANLLVVPLVTLLALPLAVLGTGLWLVGVPVAAAVLQAAAWVLQACMTLLVNLSEFQGWWPARLPGVVLWVVLAALLLSLRTVSRWSALIAAFSLALTLRTAQPAPEHGQFSVRVFDVGQGNAVLIRTRQHSLLFDAGPSFPGGADLGRDIVVPGIFREGLGRLDALVVSHADADHAGGAGAVRAALRPELVWHSHAKWQSEPGQPCHAGAQWHWDGVRFAFLHPALQPGRADQKANDRSCVLYVEGASANALFTGDISAATEQRLLRSWYQPLDLLQVPHHGSKSSSNAAFVRLLRPRVAIVSAARYSRYGHPSGAVLARYRSVGSQLVNTGTAGAVLWQSETPLTVSTSRQIRRYWHAGCAAGDCEQAR